MIPWSNSYLLYLTPRETSNSIQYSPQAALFTRLCLNKRDLLWVRASPILTAQLSSINAPHSHPFVVRGAFSLASTTSPFRHTAGDNVLATQSFCVGHVSFLLLLLLLFLINYKRCFRGRVPFCTCIVLQYITYCIAAHTQWYRYFSNNWSRQYYSQR